MELKDDMILKAIIENDENIYKYFYQKLFGIVAKFVIDNNGTYAEAEDVFQDAILVITEKFRGQKELLNKKTRVFAMFIGIVHNMWRERLREIKHYQEVVLPNYTLVAENVEMQEYISVLSAETDEVTKEKIEMVKRSMDKVKEPYKKALKTALDGGKGKDGAHKLGCSEGYYRKMVFQAKTTLAKNIKKDPTYSKYYKVDSGKPKDK